MGLLKKILVADHLSRFVDNIFANPAPHGSITIWVAVMAYAMQIYCDFSGYTDMAIGLARMFGFRLPVNFRTPYLSRNVSEFWRRWHISLSSWLRDYLYIPVRGLAEGEWNIYVALFVTMFLGGLWHGANWTFVVWGMYHGFLLMAHRILHQHGSGIWKPVAQQLPLFIREVGSRILVFLLACLGWTFFRAETFQIAFQMLSKMLRFSPTGSSPIPLGVLGLIGMVIAYDLVAYVVEIRQKNMEEFVAQSPLWCRTITFAAAVFLLLVFAPNETRPFIYFQF